MAKNEKKGKSENTHTPGIEISDRQIDIFARRLLPEVKRFFADENIQQEFEEWCRKRRGENIM